MVLLSKDEGKERIYDGDIDVKRVFNVECYKCPDNITVIEDSEEECKEKLLYEHKWDVVEDGSGEISFVCPDCALTM